MRASPAASASSSSSSSTSDLLEKLRPHSGALLTLGGILVRALTGESKYQKLRLSNPKLRERLLDAPGGKEALLLGGFASGEDAEWLHFSDAEAAKGLLQVGRERGCFVGDDSSSSSSSSSSSAEAPPKRQRTAAPSSSASSSAASAASSSGASGAAASSSSAAEVAPSITVICDSCGKARILSLEEQAGLPEDDDSVWTCSMLQREPSAGGAQGCLVVDDELVETCGLHFALVFDRAGISTRATLAAASVEEFDAGELAGELAHCIRKARDSEIEDALGDIFAPRYAEIREDLHAIGIAAPRDLSEQSATTVSSLFVHRLGYLPSGGAAEAGARVAPAEEEVQEWQERAKAKLASTPWLNEYVCTAICGDPPGLG